MKRTRTLLVLMLVAWAIPGSGQQIQESARSQIAAILAEKRLLTEDERKVAPVLRLAGKALERRRTGLTVAQPLFVEEFSAARVAPDSSVEVTIRAQVTESLLAEISALGGTEVVAFSQFNAISARLPLLALRQLARVPSVLSISPTEEPIARSLNTTSGLSTALDKAYSLANQPERQVNRKMGSVTTQGVVAHSADKAHQAAILGTGQFVCVMSNGITTLASRQATGDLPTVYVLAGQAGPRTQDEGTAMLEIVHDMAPGATLGYATASGGRPVMAQNILALRSAGCTVIVDDIGYPDEGVFQDDFVANAVDSVVGSGAVFLSAAGNDGRFNSGTSGTWQGDWVNSGYTIPDGGFLVPMHQFGSNPFNILQATPSNWITLKWSDPLGASVNDYDLFVLDATGSVVLNYSTLPQFGMQDPYEVVYCSPLTCPAGALIVVAQYSGVARALHVQAVGSPCGSLPCLAVGTNGSTYGHPATPAAVGIAAVDVHSAAGGVFVGGASNPTEQYSSDGPRKLFYYSNGAAITPGNVLFNTNGGLWVNKVDAAAADRVTTSTPGFIPFLGTSAAAPHAAAIAALVWSANPSLSANAVKNVMLSTALDIEAPGFDRDSGVGIVMAAPAVRSVLSPLPISASFSAPSIAPGGGAQYIVSFTNPNSVPLQGLAFTSTYPAAIRNSATPAPGGSGTGCSGTLTAAPNGGSFALSAGSIPALGSCLVHVTVTSVSLGTHTVSTGALTTPIALNTLEASAQLSVLAQPSAVAVASSSNPSIFGQNVTFTATVTGGGPIPTGAVTFSDAATPICSNVALNGSGQAACATSALAVGPHSINVAYGGDGYYAGSAGSLAGGQVVNPAPTATTTVVATSDPSVVAGAMFMLTATVTGNAPTGTVDFNDGTNPLPGCAAVALVGAGNARTAQCAVSSLPAGTYTLAANYSGDAGNLPSSGTVGQTVVAACVGFIDLAATSPFCPSVEWLKNRAITTGCTATEYCPSSVVSRLGMAAFMKRLGGALTPTMLWMQDSPGAVDLDTPVYACQTTDYPVAGFPRRAFVDFVFAGKSTGDADVLAEAVISFNGGADWTSLTSVARPAAVPANHWAATRGSQVHDLMVGQTARFGVRVNRYGLSTADLTESSCAIRVLVGNRDSIVSPLDAR